MGVCVCGVRCVKVVVLLLALLLVEFKNKQNKTNGAAGAARRNEMRGRGAHLLFIVGGALGRSVALVSSLTRRSLWRFSFFVLLQASMFSYTISRNVFVSCFCWCDAHLVANALWESTRSRRPVNLARCWQQLSPTTTAWSFGPFSVCVCVVFVLLRRVFVLVWWMIRMRNEIIRLP